MNRTIGTVVRGVRAPIFREGDDVVSGVAETVLTALRENGIEPRDKDVVAVTESVVARCRATTPRPSRLPPTCAPRPAATWWA